jgi:hypothetical protein
VEKNPIRRVTARAFQDLRELHSVGAGHAAQMKVSGKSLRHDARENF